MQSGSDPMKRLILIVFLFLLAVPSAWAVDFGTPEEKRQEYVAELEDNIAKTKEAIKVLQSQIEETREAPYLPDLYFRLAELFVELSRYQFYKRRELVSGQAIKINEAGDVLESKQRALDIYAGILKDYPRYRDNDKIHFFMAHEYRELGRNDDMLKQYYIILNEYKESKYRGEAYLLLGDYHFDRRELRESKENYRKVIEMAESNAHNLARYKLAWVYINEDDNKNALDLFEAIAKTGKTSFTEPEKDAGPTKGKIKGKGAEKEQSGINIIREALIDSVLCFTEVKKPFEAISFYRNIADSEITYMKVLGRLANRYYIRNQFKDAAEIYREILKINPNMVESRDQVQRLFEYTRKESDISDAQQDIELLVQHMSRYLHAWRVDEKDRLEAYNTFERSARDIATKLHIQARQSNKLVLYHQSTKAYKQYLSLFGDSQFAQEMQKNYAEALYSAGDYVKAGKEYENVVGATPEKDRQAVLNSAIYAYFEALKNPDKLTRVEVIEARRGFISAGKLFVQTYPNAKETPNLMFSIARSYYDLAEYDDAIKSFAEFIDKNPDHPKMSEAGHLALDSYHFKKDFEGLAKFGKALIAKSSIKDAKFKAEVAEIVQQSEFKAIENVALDSPTGTKVRGGSSAQNFIDFAKQYKQSGLGEKALYNAFITAKKESNADLMLRAGSELITQFPQSAYLKEIYPTLGNIALQTGDFEQAAASFEVYAEKFPQDKESGNLLYNAATIRRLLTNYDRSVSNFKVHVSREILDTDDIGQNDIVCVTFCHKTCSDSCNRSFDRYSCVHKSKC
jgi:tetratricopeptide (TPR) repeat protein